MPSTLFERMASIARKADPLTPIEEARTMNISRAHRVRDRVLAKMDREEKTAEARAAWAAIWRERQAVGDVRGTDLARLAMTIALDRGATIPEAAEIARAALKDAT